MQKLPLSLSTFRELRESNYLYVDKTKYAHELITGGRRYFLSRPVDLENHFCLNVKRNFNG